MTPTPTDKTTADDPAAEDPDAAAPAATVTELPAPAVPEFSRLSVNIPTDLNSWLEDECHTRMVGKALLVTRALQLLQNELPPL